MEELGDILKKFGQPGRSIRPGGPPPPEETKPVDECPRCGGRGWYTLDVAVGNPDFGRAITCSCQKERVDEGRITRLISYSNLGALTRYTFDSFDSQRFEDKAAQGKLGEAIKKVRAYAENPQGWLVLIGPHGSGKTHLTAAIANLRIHAGHLALFVHVPDLMDHLRSSFEPSNDMSYTDLFDRVRNAPLMILDDLRDQFSSLWALEKFQQIVNYRFNADLPTVINTCKEIEELDSYIASRLATATIAQLPGKVETPASTLSRIDQHMLERMTFSKFRLSSTLAREHKQSLEHAALAAKNYAADPDGWLTFYGSTGVGKTHLSVAIASEQLRKGKMVFFAFVPELMDYLRKTYSPDSQVTYDRLFEEVKNSQLLVLDDLGQEYASPWAYEKLYQIIVHRHNRRLPTIITTRLDFTKDPGPIGSRAQDPFIGQLVFMDAPDFRVSGRPKSRKKQTRREMPRVQH